MTYRPLAVILVGCLLAAVTLTLWAVEEVRANGDLFSMFDESAAPTVGNDIEADFDSIKSHRLQEELAEKREADKRVSYEDSELCCRVGIELNGHSCFRIYLRSDSTCNGSKEECLARQENEEREARISKRNWERRKPVVEKMCKAAQEGRNEDILARKRELKVLESDLNRALEEEKRMAAERIEAARKRDEAAAAAAEEAYRAEHDRLTREREERERLATEARHLERLGSCRKLWAAGRNTCGCAGLPERPQRFKGGPNATCEQ